MHWFYSTDFINVTERFFGTTVVMNSDAGAESRSFASVAFKSSTGVEVVLTNELQNKGLRKRLVYPALITEEFIPFSRKMSNP